MKKKNKTETHTETVQIPITPDLKEQIKKHCELSKTSQNKFIESLIKNYFNNKVVSNDFIKLDRPFYFNINDLINNNSVVCSLDKPTTELKNYYIIDKVINNLDKYEPNLKTFCNGGNYEHKGIIINCFEINGQIQYFYLLFEFKDISNTYKELFNINGYYHHEKPYLKISIIKPNELIYNGFDLNQDKELLKKLNQQETDIKEQLTKEKLYNIKQNENNNFKEMLNIEDPNIEVEYIRKHESLIILYENYHILRPYYMEHFLNTLIYLIGVNPEIKNYIESTYNLNIDNLTEFKKNWNYNGKINLLFQVLNTDENKQGFLNLNTLLNMELKNISLKEAINENMNYI